MLVIDKAIVTININVTNAKARCYFGFLNNIFSVRTESKVTKDIHNVTKYIFFFQIDAALFNFLFVKV